MQSGNQVNFDLEALKRIKQKVNAYVTAKINLDAKKIESSIEAIFPNTEHSKTKMENLTAFCQEILNRSQHVNTKTPNEKEEFIAENIANWLTDKTRPELGTYKENHINVVNSIIYSWSTLHQNKDTELEQQYQELEKENKAEAEAEEKEEVNSTSTSPLLQKKNIQSNRRKSSPFSDSNSQSESKTISPAQLRDMIITSLVKQAFSDSEEKQNTLREKINEQKLLDFILQLEVNQIITPGAHKSFISNPIDSIVNLLLKKPTSGLFSNKDTITPEEINTVFFYVSDKKRLLKPMQNANKNIIVMINELNEQKDKKASKKKNNLSAPASKEEKQQPVANMEDLKKAHYQKMKAAFKAALKHANNVTDDIAETIIAPLIPLKDNDNAIDEEKEPIYLAFMKYPLQKEKAFKSSENNSLNIEKINAIEKHQHNLSNNIVALLNQHLNQNEEFNNHSTVAKESIKTLNEMLTKLKEAFTNTIREKMTEDSKTLQYNAGLEAIFIAYYDEFTRRVWNKENVQHQDNSHLHFNGIARQNTYSEIKSEGDICVINNNDNKEQQNEKIDKFLKSNDLILEKGMLLYSMQKSDMEAQLTFKPVTHDEKTHPKNSVSRSIEDNVTIHAITKSTKEKFLKKNAVNVVHYKIEKTPGEITCTVKGGKDFYSDTAHLIKAAHTAIWNVLALATSAKPELILTHVKNKKFLANIIIFAKLYGVTIVHEHLLQREASRIEKTINKEYKVDANEWVKEALQKIEKTAPHTLPSLSFFNSRNPNEKLKPKQEEKQNDLATRHSGR